MSGANRDDPASDAPGPDIDPEDDATQAVDLPGGLFAAIPDPESRPLAVSIRATRAPVSAVGGALEPEDPGDQTITEVPAEYAPAAYRPPRHASDERPVPIPLPASAERPIPRVISTPVVPFIDEPPTEVEPGPTQRQPSPRAPIPSAPPEPLPDLHTAARRIPMARAIPTPIPRPVARPIPAAPAPARPIPVAPIPAAPIPAAPIPAAPLPAPPLPASPAAPPAPADDDFDEKTNIFLAEPRGPQLPRGRLTIIEGAEPGKTWYLNRARTQLGRSADNDIVLLDINISRGHLRIDRHGQGFRVVDLDSGNGTQLNDRRITREELFDGDRVRLGEHLLEFETMDGARPRVRDAAHTDPNIAVGPTTTPGRRIGIPRTWIIAWSVATFLAVFGTMYIARTVKARQAAAARLEGAQAAVADADAALAERDWHRAREALLRARAAQPELIEYKPRLSAINAEIRANKALRLMQLQLKAGKLVEARLAFGDVPEASVYRPEATILERRLAEAERDQQVARARRERDAGRANVARQIVAKVLAGDPLHAEAKAVLGTLPADVPTPTPDAPASAAPKAPASKAPASKSSVVREDAPRRRAAPRPKAPAKGVAAKLKAGDAAYRAGRFADAQAQFAAAAEAARGEDATKAKQKAAAAGALASALPAAQQADTRNQSGQAVKEFERALKADRTLGGRNAGRIRPPLARHLCREAMKAFMRRQYDRAGKLNGRALQLDPNLDQARRLQERISKMPR